MENQQISIRYSTEQIVFLVRKYVIFVSLYLRVPLASLSFIGSSRYERKLFELAGIKETIFSETIQAVSEFLEYPEMKRSQQKLFHTKRVSYLKKQEKPLQKMRQAVKQEIERIREENSIKDPVVSAIKKDDFLFMILLTVIDDLIEYVTNPDLNKNDEFIEIKVRELEEDGLLEDLKEFLDKNFNPIDHLVSKINSYTRKLLSLPSGKENKMIMMTFKVVEKDRTKNRIVLSNKLGRFTVAPPKDFTIRSRGNRYYLVSPQLIEDYTGLSSEGVDVVLRFIALVLEGLLDEAEIPGIKEIQPVENPDLDFFRDFYYQLTENHFRLYLSLIIKVAKLLRQGQLEAFITHIDKNYNLEIKQLKDFSYLYI